MPSDEPVRVERSAKRLRAYLNGQLVFDTLAPRLVWELPYFPTYYIPRVDVHAELVATERTKSTGNRGNARLWTVQVTGGKAAEAASTYPESPVEELRELVRFDWQALDSWFEEDEEVHTHARSPYARIDILPSSRHVQVRHRGGQVVADSVRAVVLHETGLPPRWYLPKTDVRMDLLTPTETVTHCPHKGQAEYWRVQAGSDVIEDAVWSYRYPLPESIRIAALVSFDSSKSDVLVDGVKQP